MTVREMVGAIQGRIISGLETPQQAVQDLTILGALVGNVNDEIRKAEMEFNRHLSVCRNLHQKANQAKIVAEASPEYERLRAAKDEKEEVLLLIGSRKYAIRDEHEAMRLR